MQRQLLPHLGWLAREARRLGQAFAVLVDERVAIPCQIGRRFTRTGCSVQVSGDAFGGLRAAKQPAIFRFANDGVNGRQVCQDSRSRHGCEGAWWKRHPDVFANLDVQSEVRPVRRADNGCSR
jgi:hypothetical protein